MIVMMSDLHGESEKMNVMIVTMSDLHGESEIDVMIVMMSDESEIM